MSLAELEKRLPTFKGNRKDAFFVTFTSHPNKKIIEITILPSEFKSLIDAATYVQAKTKHRVKPMLVKRPRLKRKQ
jgi:hypothetical protein